MGSINKAIMCYLLAIGNLVGVAAGVSHLVTNLNMGMDLTWPIVSIAFFTVFGIMWLRDGRMEHKAWNERVEKDD